MNSQVTDRELFDREERITNEERRLQALNLAFNCLQGPKGVHVDISTLVEEAKKFETYLKGE